MPQRLGTRLAVGRKVIQRGDELVAFVWETVCFVALKDWLHVRLLPALSLVGIKDLQMDGGATSARLCSEQPQLDAPRTSFSRDEDFYLEYPGNLLRLGSVYISLRDRSHMK